MNNGYGKMKDKIESGSVTVEAALVLPLFLIFSLQVFSLFEMMSLYVRMQSALTETAVEAATFLYAAGDYEVDEGTSFLLSESFVREQVTRKVGGGRLTVSVIRGGIAGVHLFRSGMDNGSVHLMVTYQVEPWLSFGGIGRMTLMNHAKVVSWRGFEKKDEISGEAKGSSETVYVTKTGSAYHLYRNCSYLMADIRNVSGTEVEFIRNNSGGKYYACEICSKNQSPMPGETYTVSVWGNRYHQDGLCVALYKDVTAIPINEVGSRHLCTKCAAK